MINRLMVPVMRFREDMAEYPVAFCELGLIDYDECLALQEAARQRIIESPDSPGVLFFLEHPHTYTHGRLAEEGNLLLDAETLERRGVAVRRIDRGGDITYHGPGQLVAYPIFNLKRSGLNVRQYCHALEEVIIRVLHRFDIEAGRHPKYMGTWVGGKKICAIGVGVRKWVTKHGLAFNINTDMSYFDGIIPCGIREFDVTSLQQIREGEMQNWRAVSAMVRESFVDVFNLDMQNVAREQLEWEYLARK